MKARDHERILREATESLRRQIAELTADRDHWKQEAEQARDAHREAVRELGDEIHQISGASCTYCGERPQRINRLGIPSGLWLIGKGPKPVR